MFLNDGVVDISKFLLERFNYNFDGDINKLFQQPFIEIEGVGVDAFFWIVDGDDRYLFKRIEDYDYNVWGELLSLEFAKNFGIPCALYKPVVIGDLKGVVTKSFKTEKDNLVHGIELVQNAVDNNKDKYGTYKNSKELQTKMCNYESLKDIISNLDNVSDKDKENAILALENILIFDLFTRQGDRHLNNIAFICNDDSFSLSCIFDNNVCFGLKYPNMRDRCIEYRNDSWNSKYYDYDNLVKYYKLNILYSFNDKKNIKECVLEILNSDNERLKDILFTYSSLCNEELLINIIDKLEKQYNMMINGELYNYILGVFNNNIEMINECIDSYRRDIDEVRRNGNAI